MKNTTNKIIGLIALNSIRGIGPAFIKKNVVVGTFAEGANLSHEISEILMRNNKGIDLFETEKVVRFAYEIYEQCLRENISITGLTASDYPSLLSELNDPPPVLYYRGEKRLLDAKTVAIIGTRKPTNNGSRIAERIGSHFANLNWSICNGLSEGIDDFSIKLEDKMHQSVIGILAGGLNYATKKTISKKVVANANEVLANGGLLLSECPPDTKENPNAIIKSCRIQAGISDGLILVQSSLNGGSRFATKAFAEMKRPIGVINPIAEDWDNEEFEANRELANNSFEGLAKFVDIKREKIKAITVLAIKSKSDYSIFEGLMQLNKHGFDKDIRTSLFD